MAIERLLRTLHAWLGVLILPWIVLAGLTGLYMNHERLVLSIFPEGDVSAVQFVSEGQVQTEASARDLAEGLFGSLGPARTKRFEGRQAYAFAGPDAGEVLVDRQTGHLWFASRYAVTLYSPKGEKLAQDLRLGRILSSLHGRGWVGRSLGTWPADITAAALMLFGLSGLVLFFAPRLRRRKNRRARLAYQRLAGSSAKVAPGLGQ